MKKLLLLIILALAPALAQTDSVTVEIDPIETCPTGWATVDTAWSLAARIYYAVPDELIAAYRRARIGYGTGEFRVTQAFVDAVYPTATQQTAAFDSGKLRSEPAASGTVRSCTIGS